MATTTTGDGDVWSFLGGDFGVDFLKMLRIYSSVLGVVFAMISLVCRAVFDHFFFYETDRDSFFGNRIF